MRIGGQEGATRVIGIDLGTTNCCLSAFHDGQIKILEIDGHRTMPSCVAFTQDSYLVGVEAKAQMHLNPTNTIFDAKRLIGREFAEKAVQADIINMHWPFLVRGSETGRPYFAVHCLGEDMKVMPEMVAQLLLTKMKETAERYLGGPLDGAVITVPAYFSDSQRQATKIAALQANINVLSTGIINEPTAAAVAYSRQQNQAESRVLIFDLGGGTFDVSVVSIDGTLVEVKASHGDNHLGGEDITNNLVRHFLSKIQDRYGINLGDPNVFRSYGDETPQQLGASVQRALLRLKVACEDIKCALSDMEATVKKIDYLWPQMPQLQARLQRRELEEMNESIFQLCMKCTDKALLTAGVEPAALDQVVLVGGSTRIPKIRQLLSDRFGLEKVCDSVDPDEVVAYGAGVQAAGISGLTQATLIDVASHSLGMKSIGDIMSVVFPINHRVGTTKERSFTTIMDNQTVVKFEVYEGEDEKASNNTLLDSFNLTGLPKLPKGEVDISVKFRVEFDGTLNVTAFDRSKGGEGKKVRKSLRVSRGREESAVRERAEMEDQASKLAAVKHRDGMQYAPSFHDTAVTAY